MIEITERRIPSADQTHQLYCRVFYPEGEIRGLFHVVHGMTEHIRRYEKFMTEMAEQGWLCFGFDNLGHGYTAGDDDLGYIGEWQWPVDDVRNVSLLMKQEYGEALPCVLLGHSMGSFIARCAATPRIWDKLIIMGTGGPNPASRAGLLLISRLISHFGERSYSSTIEKLLFGSYNSHFPGENDFVAMISTIPEVKEAYRQDKYCTFRFTLNAFYVLVKLQMLCNRKTWYKHISGNLPILLVSGSECPVGDYGKGVEKVYNELNSNGKDVRMKLYEGCRHEILNDVCHDEVVKDISDFVNPLLEIKVPDAEQFDN